MNYRKKIIPKKDLFKIAKIICDRHQHVFNKKMPEKEHKDLLVSLENCFEEKRLFYRILPSGKVGFFFTYECSIMYEYKEFFFRISNCYCVADPKIRKKFYGLIKEASLEIKEVVKIKRMVVDVYCEDYLSKEYFSKKGQLTSVELVGKTKVGIKFLKNEITRAKNISLVKMSAGDLPKLVNLDLSSHLADKTSRMREIFIKPDGKKGMRSFYKHMLKRKTCFVAKENKKIAGSICYFIDEKNKHGLVASIFVANQFKGLECGRIVGILPAKIKA